VPFPRFGATGRFRVMAGSGVALPKSRCSGCEPAALATESFPFCPPEPTPTERPARWASSCNRAKMASLMRRLRDRSASFPVFPSAILRS